MAKAGALDRLSHWLSALEAEQQYRSGSLDPAAATAARERLDQELDEMARRRRAAPDFVEPTEAEHRQALAEIEDWLARRGREM